MTVNDVVDSVWGRFVSRFVLPGLGAIAMFLGTWALNALTGSIDDVKRQVDATRAVIDTLKDSGAMTRQELAVLSQIVENNRNRVDDQLSQLGHRLDGVTTAIQAVPAQVGRHR